MRLVIRPDTLTERIGLTLGLAPRPLIEVTGGILLARALIAGVELGVFEAIESSGSATAEDLSLRLGCTQAGIEALLAALTGSGYLRRAGGRYRNARVTRRWLLPGSPHPIVRYMRFMTEQSRWLDGIEERIRSGGSAEIHDIGRDRVYWERYLGALEELARSQADSIVRAIPLTAPPRRLLDVAGGHGYFSLALCRRHPGLEGEILDLEPAIAIARPRVAAAAMDDRIRLRAGDLRTSDWGSDYDLVLLFNILHHLNEDDAVRAIGRARTALRAGGTLAIWELRETTDERRPSQVGGLMSLFFYATSGRRVPAGERIEAWMAEAGFEGMRARALRRSPFGQLITGFAKGMSAAR